MKNIAILSLLYLTSTLLSCNSTSTNPINTKEELLDKFMFTLHHQDVQKINSKIVILNTEFCETFECEAYFSSLENRIQFYSKNEAFMRGLKKFIVIDNIDTDRGVIKMRKRFNTNYEFLEVK